MEHKTNSNPTADVLPSARHDHKPMLSDAVFRPMLFSTEMVRALLDGRKTQTRRIVKAGFDLSNFRYNNIRMGDNWFFTDNGTHNLGVKNKVKIGDIIWVRETWAETCDEKGIPILAYKTGLPRIIGGQNVLYDEIDTKWSIDNFPSCGKWKPSLFMPKSACRLFLEVVNVRLERLHDISESDAIAEGIEAEYFKKDWWYKIYTGDDSTLYPCISYRTLWSKINGQKSWEENPFVWVYDFKLVERPHGFR